MQTLPVLSPPSCHCVLTLRARTAAAAQVLDDVKYLEATYGASSAVARVGVGRHPIYFAYDSYHVAPEDWAQVLGSGGGGGKDNGAVVAAGAGAVGGVGLRRGRPVAGLFLGLWLEAGHGADLARGGFDGFYTYFAASGFVFGSTPQR